MEWTDLEPVVKVVPRVQAAVYVNKDGKPRVRLTLSETFLKETGHPKRANVQAGTDGKLAKIRLVLGDGKFTIADLRKGGARISNIPAIAPVPDGARETEACEVETKSAKEAIIVLPLAAWEAQLAPAPQRQPVSQPPARASTAASARIDAIKYLAAKGEKISRLAGDWFMHKGERVPKSEIAAVINRYRKNSDLSLITVADFD